MAHVCGDLIKMQGRNSLDSLSTVFHLETVLEADLVSKDRDLCAQQSAKSLVITIGGQLENRCHTQCVLLQEKYI